MTFLRAFVALALVIGSIALAPASAPAGDGVFLSAVALPTAAVAGGMNLHRLIQGEPRPGPGEFGAAAGMLAMAGGIDIVTDVDSNVTALGWVALSVGAATTIVSAMNIIHFNEGANTHPSSDNLREGTTAASLSPMLRPDAGGHMIFGLEFAVYR